MAESFLKNAPTPILGNELFAVDDQLIRQNALLCPEASIRPAIFNSYFNSSEYKLISARYQPKNKVFMDGGDAMHFTIGDLVPESNVSKIDTSLLLIEPGIDLIRNNEYSFSSKAGDASIAYKHSDPKLGDYEDLEYNGDADFNTTTSKIRGEFNTYVGCSYGGIQYGTYYNVYPKDYDFDVQ